MTIKFKYHFHAVTSFLVLCLAVLAVAVWVHPRMPARGRHALGSLWTVAALGYAVAGEGWLAGTSTWAVAMMTAAACLVLLLGPKPSRATPACVLAATGAGVLWIFGDTVPTGGLWW